MKRWPFTFAIALSVATACVTVAFALWLNLPLVDPDGFIGPAYIRLPVLLLLFLAIDIVPRGIRRAQGLRDVRPACRRVIRDEWSWARLGNVVAGLSAFYVCYVGYRNLKGDLPFVRKNVLYDDQLLRLDRALMLGHTPSTLLHHALGVSVSAYILSLVYVAYLPLVPISLAAALVWSRDSIRGSWYATALCVNWILGVVSYYALPTQGPAFARPSLFADLPPNTSVADLQVALLSQRERALDYPTGFKSLSGIAGFASLHVSVVLTAALIAQRLGLRAVIRWTIWIYLILVILSTCYFGWHYLADDVAGAVIAWVSVVVGAWATGQAARGRGDPGHEPDATALPVTEGVG